MLVDQLLLPLGIQHDGEAVKPRYDPPELKTVYKKYRDLLFVCSCLIEKNVL